MKKLLFGLLAVFLIVGCGEDTSVRNMKKPAAKGTNYLAQGVQYLNDKDIAKAIQSFDMAIKQDPGNPDTYMVLGQVYLRLNELSRAVDVYKAATKVDSLNGEAYYMLATTQALIAKQSEGKTHRENMDEAKKAVQRSIEIFMQQKDEERFKRGVVLLKALDEQAEATN